MVNYQKSADGETWTDHNHAACFYEFYQGQRNTYVRVRFGMNTKAARLEGEHSYIDKQKVYEFAANLKRCGFKFDLTVSKYVLPMAYIPATGKYVGGKEAEDCYAWTIAPGDNSFMMRKYLLNAIRWCTMAPGCIQALDRLMGEADPKTQREGFNLMVIASQAECRGSHHNLDCHGAYAPITQEFWNKLRKDEISGGPGAVLKCTSVDRGQPNLEWLKEAGAYKRYMDFIGTKKAPAAVRVGVAKLAGAIKK